MAVVDNIPLSTRYRANNIGKKSRLRQSILNDIIYITIFNITFTATLIALCSQDFDEKKFVQIKKKHYFCSLEKKTSRFLFILIQIYGF